MRSPKQQDCLVQLLLLHISIAVNLILLQWSPLSPGSLQSCVTVASAFSPPFQPSLGLRPHRVSGHCGRTRRIPTSTRGFCSIGLSAVSSSSSSTTKRSATIATELPISETMIHSSTKREFNGKTILLTGASGGLGRSLALQLATHCAPKMLILSARSVPELDAVAQECRALCADIVIHVIRCDLADPASVQALAKEALKCVAASASGNDATGTAASASVPSIPKIDVLINNGGVSSRSRFVDTDLSVDERCMQINFLAGAALAKALVPAMIGQDKSDKGRTDNIRGRIIWISSVQGLMGIPNRSSYAASKFAVQGYCEALRAELKSDGVYVHTVSPGYIRTNLSRSALTGTASTTHGVLDATTADGAHPGDVAATILNQVASGAVDFTVAAGVTATVAIWMRLLCPGILRNMLVKRYQKSLLEKEKTE